MQKQDLTGKKRAKRRTYTNTIESLKETPSYLTRAAAAGTKRFGQGMYDQLFGSYNRQVESVPQDTRGQEQEKEIPHVEKKGQVFQFREHQESHARSVEIKQLLEEIKQEIGVVRKKEASLLSQVKDIEKATIESLTDEPGIYHVRFLELLLSLLRTVSAKISESATWLEAFITKKKKRGSAFLVRSKKMGTQYSLSQELSTARGVQ